MMNEFGAPTRRHFLKTSAAAAAATLVGPFAMAEPPARWTRANVTSPQGQKALQTYQKAVIKMLSLPPGHPHNWFRNAFVHLMDCPHGNWWFYVWHRGYLGFFERTIRTVSGDQSFAIPYWDWTALPGIPSTMFGDGLTPKSPSFLPYNKDITTFTNYFKASLKKYWDTLNPAQRAQLKTRGYSDFDLLWNDVDGYDPKTKKVDTGNISFAANSIARYPTTANPNFPSNIAYDVSAPIISAGLSATKFVTPISVAKDSFNSSKKASHNDAPGGKDSFFSTLEGFPHNNVHNYLGGAGATGYPANGPFGNMTNFLSPFDPIFFLHHANMDRLWDVWTQRQRQAGRPFLPTGADWTAYAKEPFLFFVDGDGHFVTNGKAEDFVSTEPFGYSYTPGTGSAGLQGAAKNAAIGTVKTLIGSIKGNSATVELPADAVRSHLAQSGGPGLTALVTVPHPSNSPRSFDVIVGAPQGVTHFEPSSPYYAGTIAFFGSMGSMAGMDMDSTFVVPLPHKPELFSAAKTANGSVPLNIRVVPSNGGASAPSVLKGARVQLQ